MRLFRQKRGHSLIVFDSIIMDFLIKQCRTILLGSLKIGAL